LRGVIDRRMTDISKDSMKKTNGGLRDEETGKPVCSKCHKTIERDEFAGVVRVDNTGDFYHNDHLPERT